MPERPTPEQIDRDIKAAFEALHPRQIEIFRRMSSEQKGHAVAELFSAMRKLAFASEREMHPDLPEAEIHRRAILRLMRASEWESEWMKRIFGF